MPVHDLDTSGLKCPLPVLKAKKALRALDAGERLHVTATDPNALNDVPAYCTEAGHRLVETRTEGGKYLFVIEKGAT
jgi:tRNA 2-thiouridine synthesizing protein A